MVTEKMNRDMAIGLYCRLNEIDWDQEKVEQTDHFENWYATMKAALSTDAEPVACEYGHDNGDGTYTPTYGRWPLPSHIKAHPDWPIKFFYAAPPAPSVAVKALQDIRNEFQVERNGEKIGGISHDMGSLPRIIDILDAALSAQVQEVAVPTTDMKELQAWVYQQRVSLQTNDPEYFAKYGVWKAIGAQIRAMLAAAPAAKLEGKS